MSTSGWGPATYGAGSATGGRDVRRRGLRQVRRSALAIFGVICAALGSAAGAGVTALLANWYDPNKVADSFASTPPVTLIETGSMSHAEGPWGWVSRLPVSQKALDAWVRSGDGGTQGQTIWDTAHHIVPLGREVLVVTLQGNRAVPVHIVDLKPHIESCGPSAAGTLAYTAPQGLDGTVQLTTNLDRPDPAFTVSGDHATNDFPGRAADAFFDSHSVTLSRDEVLTFQITAGASTRMCSWDLQADEVVDGKSHTQILGQDDPWQVSGGAPFARYRDRYVNTVVLGPTSPRSSPYRAESSQFICRRLWRQGRSALLTHAFWPSSGCH